MNYIVDPMWFYWLQAISGLKIMCIIMLICSAVILVVSWWSMTDENFNTIKPNSIKNRLPIIVILFLIGLLGTLFIPSRETMISIMIAKFATYDNAQITIDTIKSAVDYIIQAIKSV